MLKGIDLSQFQTTTPSLAGLSFVTLRASIAGRQDPMYETHYANARKAGVVVMAYHYGWPAAEVAIDTQVNLFLAVAKNADFLWIDQEQAGFDDAQTQQFIDSIRAFGRPIGLYHSSSGFGGVNADAQWVADYRSGSVTAGYPRTADGTKEFPGWDFWQHTSKGQIAGYTGNLDFDYMNPNTTLASLLRLGYVWGPAAATKQALAVEAAVASAVKPLNERIVAQAAQLETTTEALKAAPGIERARIAAAEEARINAI